jgi:hypothetical protein
VDFEIEHFIDADPDAVAEALLDSDYQESLSGIGKLGERTLLSQDEQSDGVVIRRVRCSLGVDPGPAKKFLGGSDPAWVEEARWDPETLCWGWTITPEVAGDLVSASGTIELEEDSEGLTLRRVTGHVKVKVPIYGSRVERVIVDGLEDAYEEEAERLRSWLADE